MSSVKEIAKMAEVSLTTVSQILRNPNDSRYAESTRRKILDISRKVNYSPSRIAYALAKNKAFSIGLVGADWLDPHHHLAIAEAGKIVSKHSHNLVVAATTSYSNWYQMLYERQVDFLITVGFWFPIETDLDHLSKFRNKIASVGPAPETTENRYWGLSVTWDESASSALMADHFLRLGHREMAVISGDGISGRTTGFVNRAREAGCLPWIVLTNTGGGISDSLLSLLKDYPRERVIRTSPYTGQDRPSMGALQLAVLMAAHPEVTGIFCRNELYALGAIRQASDQGLSIPADLSIAGHNDCSELMPTFPVMTTIRTPVVQAIRLVLEKYFSEQLTEDSEVEDITLGCQFIEGATLGFPCSGRKD